ncbi:MAG TPA: FxsA family protein [Devosia sp.]|nr:FxsA family protein [Devosia sp.]
MGRLVFALFMILPLVEIALFVVVGGAIGLWPTLLWVLLAGVAGTLVLRYQGRSLVSEMRGTMTQGVLPAQALADGMMIGMAGMLLILPGFFSDFVAILLLLPPVRKLIYNFAKSRVTVVSAASATYTETRPAGAPKTIELDESDWRHQD